VVQADLAEIDAMVVEVVVAHSNAMNAASEATLPEIVVIDAEDQIVIVIVTVTDDATEAEAVMVVENADAILEAHLQADLNQDLEVVQQNRDHEADLKLTILYFFST
jgi:hypothetical protein